MLSSEPAPARRRLVGKQPLGLAPSTSAPMEVESHGTKRSGEPLAQEQAHRAGAFLSSASVPAGQSSMARCGPAPASAPSSGRAKRSAEQPIEQMEYDTVEGMLQIVEVLNTEADQKLNEAEEIPAPVNW